MKNWKILGFIATAVIVLAIPIYVVTFYLKDTTHTISDEAEYIGRDRCKDCHQKEYKAFTGSHHDLAMDIANDSTVLGNFNNAEFEFNGVTSKFFRKGEKFFVRTNGPGGFIDDFEIAHTFGYTPLQQYLIPFEKGRYQCLPIAWDTEKNKWFSLVEATYGENIPEPSDWLYWTNNGQNWNGMCAECHSTNLQKNFNPETKEYSTTYAEIDVSCEACHGPGSKHEEWANLPEMARSTDSNFDLVVNTSNINNQQYVDLCVYCHSRRSSLSSLEFTNGHSIDMVIPRVLDENYFPDGQILEEDYVFASFTHSKMFDNDVQCNDCHDVHSGERLFEGNELCAQCHQPEVYDSYDHHFHKKKGESGKTLKLSDRTYEVGEGALCVNCHMPGRYYMGNDFRNDHSLRVPRPDLTTAIGTPNACNQCHENETPRWADNYITKWYGEKRKPHFGQIFAKARNGDENVLDKLIDIEKNGLHLPIVRATAVSLLTNYNSQESLEAIKWALNDDEPIVRYNAAHSFNSHNPEQLLESILPLLNDPIRSIRIEAGFKLSSLPKEQFPSKKKKLLENVIQEYIAVMRYSADFAASRHNLGILYTNLGKAENAAEQYYESLSIDSLFYPAKVNLSVVLNQLGRNEEAEKILRDLIKTHPEFYDSYYSLGLLLAEQNKYEEASTYLEKASELLPNRARIFYNLGLILQYLQRNNDAENALLNAKRIEPNSLDYSYTLADHYIKTNQIIKAKQIANEIQSKFPSSGLGEQLLNYLKK
jgi:tetratricopeptide (TPR) repeat protein